MEVIKWESQPLARVTEKAYLTIYAPREMTRRYGHVQTVRQALDTSSDAIASLKRELGQKKTEALIKIQLIYLNDLLNLKRPLNEIQIDEIASEVVAVHYNLKMVDVHLIMRRARIGQYGEFYENISMPKVLRWFSDYFEERCGVASQRSMDVHSQNKEWNDRGRKSSEEKEKEAFAVAKTQYIMDKAKKSNEQRTKSQATERS